MQGTYPMESHVYLSGIGALIVLGAKISLALSPADHPLHLHLSDLPSITMGHRTEVDEKLELFDKERNYRTLLQ